jgi:hypothetical protein
MAHVRLAWLQVTPRAALAVLRGRVAKRVHLRGTMAYVVARVAVALASQRTRG